jgi:hypothetical protein
LLEARRVLDGGAPALVVDTALDELDGDHSAGRFSLREAVAVANARPGHDSIHFAPSLAGQRIRLELGELSVTDAVTIDARSLESKVTIDAQQRSRFLNVTRSDSLSRWFDVTLAGLVVTEGRTTANGQMGGAVFNPGIGVLRILNCDFIDNRTLGIGSHGGAIVARNVFLDGVTFARNWTAGSGASGGALMADRVVTVERSTFVENQTLGDNSPGGAIASRGSGRLSISDTVIARNSTRGLRSYGGGVIAEALTVTTSTVEGNYTQGAESIGGGILASTLTITSSTIAANFTTGDGSPGGGVAVVSLTLQRSTVSGNWTSGRNSPGGAFTGGGGQIIQSTITRNEVRHPQSYGAAWGALDGAGRWLSMTSSIVAGNTGGDARFGEIAIDGGRASASHSVIGNLVTLLNADNATNLRTDDPRLAPLADNGAPTKTHALLPGSPALDAGDPAVVLSANSFDQRGAGFARVVGPRIDIGAFESQGVPRFPLGDYNRDGVVNVADYTVGADSLGAVGTDHPANGDDTGASAGRVDDADLAFWSLHYANTTVPTTPHPTAAGVRPAFTPGRRTDLGAVNVGAIDEALAALLVASTTDDESD